MLIDETTSEVTRTRGEEQVHEFIAFSFAAGVGAEDQVATMRALDSHLAGCDGLICREYFRNSAGRWVEHVVWESQAALEGAAGIEEDPAVAALFERFDTTSVAYACCERVGPDSAVGSAGTFGPA